MFYVKLGEDYKKDVEWCGMENRRRRIPMRGRTYITQMVPSSLWSLKASLVLDSDLSNEMFLFLFAFWINQCTLVVLCSVGVVSALSQTDFGFSFRNQPIWFQFSYI